VLLVCSAGGHLLQLLALRSAWDGFDRLWVTLEAEDSMSLLRDEPVVLAHGPTIRSLRNLARNLVLARRVIRRSRPAVIVTTGAALAVPFAWVGRAYAVPTVYVESLTRIERPSLSYRLIAPVVDRTYVQWPELVGAVRNGRYVGSILSGPR
jgi:UDP-N-acetylglucosamine:LPS N-acetylglucosamine transferase